MKIVKLGLLIMTIIILTGRGKNDGKTFAQFYITPILKLIREQG